MIANLLLEKKVGNPGATLVDSLLQIMKIDSNVYYMDCDLCGALGSAELVKQMPEQSINCGIMEANMIGVAAGMSLKGKIPFTHSFGTFSTRRVADQVFLSGCYNKANVKILGSDPGIAAEKNGGTHMPFEDIGIFRSFPEITILDVADDVLMRNLLPKIANQYGMMYIRFPRKNATCYYSEDNDFEIGKAKILKEGTDVSIIASGLEVPFALEAATELKKEGISTRVVDMYTVKPIDKVMILDCAAKTRGIVTAENHNVIGGLGSAVAEVLCESHPCIMERIGVVEEFGQVGTAKYLAEQYKMTSKDIIEACKKVISKNKI